jgi:hypothetical protein
MNLPDACEESYRLANKFDVFPGCKLFKVVMGFIENEFVTYIITYVYTMD